MKPTSAGRPATVTSTTLLDGLKDPADRVAWERCVGRYRPLILAYASRVGLSAEDGEDIAQQALLRFARDYAEGKYDPRRGRLRSWLFGIVHNAIRELHRGARRGEPLGRELSEALVSPAALEEAWEQEWRQALLGQGLAEIRREVHPTTLQAFERFAVRGEAVEDVARELGLTENAVYGAKRRVLGRLRELLPLLEEVS